MDSFRGFDKRDLCFIPFSAEKGDCPYCQTGVLFRNSIVEESFGVSEGYTCDCCNRPFIESIYLIKRDFWQPIVPRRYFMWASQKSSEHLYKSETVLYSSKAA